MKTRKPKLAGFLFKKEAFFIFNKTLLYENTFTIYNLNP